ncbi:MAG TPA: DUF4445 domain-containing protein, partial [Clostridiaceae bacterium]|nr:DUF4445 domain-containing protein [Clostridiaceae bacterium]
MKLTYIIDGISHVVELTEATNLLSVLREQNVRIDAVCNGNGTCGKCRVRCTEGIPEPSFGDKQAMSAAELAQGWRLACLIQVMDDMTIECPSDISEIDVLTKVMQNKGGIDPPVRTQTVTVSRPDVEDQRDDWTRLRDACGNNDLTIHYSALLTLHDQLYRALEHDKGKLQVDFYDHFAVAVTPASEAKQPLGLAIDIGSTTLAAYLHDLSDGRLIEAVGATNPQRQYGADVISRINYTMTNENGTSQVQKAVVDAINNLIDKLCKEDSKDAVREIVITGNTIMTHFLLGLPTASIATAPFAPVFTAAKTLSATEIGLNVDAMLTIMPSIASYVGGDITGGMIACDLTASDKWSLLIDLGTNGEIALGRRGECLACATAAGPAFEGATIRHGTGAIAGAINTVHFERNPMYTTIGNKDPIGICGSGVLDVAAQLLQHELIDETGRLLDPDKIEHTQLSKRIRQTDNYKEFVIAGSVDDPNAITFTQKDVREIQLAKAAVRAGIEILLEEAGVDYHDVERLYIAGGFGNYMNIDSTVAIGLIPRELKERTLAVGNSAGTGASYYLLSKSIRDKVNALLPITRYIELSSHSGFMDAYMD